MDLRGEGGIGIKMGGEGGEGKSKKKGKGREGKRGREEKAFPLL